MQNGKKKIEMKGEIRNQHNLKIILPGQLVQRRERSNSTSYMYQRYIHSLHPEE